MKNADAAQVASVYKHFYPLFQQAYVDLGYPDGYFNDRLVEVIDHLLATPEVAGPIKLTQPGVFYQYADPSIEERSAGQKAHDSPRQPECRDRERKIARAAQGSREAVRRAEADKLAGRATEAIRGGAIMHKVALVLAIAAIGEGAVTLHLVRQLHEERENAQTLQARVTELERTRAATGSGRDIRRSPDAADGFAVSRPYRSRAHLRRRPELPAAAIVAANASVGRRPHAHAGARSGTHA